VSERTIFICGRTFEKIKILQAVEEYRAHFSKADDEPVSITRFMRWFGNYKLHGRDFANLSKLFEEYGIPRATQNRQPKNAGEVPIVQQVREHLPVPVRQMHEQDVLPFTDVDCDEPTDEPSIDLTIKETIAGVEGTKNVGTVEESVSTQVTQVFVLSPHVVLVDMQWQSLVSYVLSSLS